ncbi:ferritin [Melioribacteraceae bacterium 4301-Me]|uniref:ferritin n=1 Tax=Pyranulibacter aquaticus TaxID=3163344 RepID=UPI003596701B
MLSAKMEKALNDQINAEFYSSYLYLAMSAYFQSINFTGFATWMQVQSTEEYGHAMKIYNYLIEVNSRVKLELIEKPQESWKSPLEAFQEAYKHELYITDRINKLVNQAIAEQDHATNIFLQWFVKEQVEEVSTVNQIIEKFKLIGENKSALYMLDRELGQRK